MRERRREDDLGLDRGREESIRRWDGLAGGEQTLKVGGQRVERRFEGGLRLACGDRPEPPLVSIVTVVFRAKEELQNLLSNLSSFDPATFEWIVIDGGSDDGTVELLRQFDDKIDYWLSEPDTGVFDAMNKGMSAARGEFVFHLNEGDRLRTLPYEILSQCHANGIDVAVFPVFIHSEEKVFRPKTGFWLRIDNTWHHQGAFYRRARLPKYDVRYLVFGDFELNQRMLRSGCTVRLFEDVVAEKLLEGQSSSGVGVSEIYRSIRRNFGLPYVALSLLLFKYRGLRYRTARALAWLHFRS